MDFAEARGDTSIIVCKSDRDCIKYCKFFHAGKPLCFFNQCECGKPPSLKHDGAPTASPPANYDILIWILAVLTTKYVYLDLLILSSQYQQSIDICSFVMDQFQEVNKEIYFEINRVWLIGGRFVLFDSFFFTNKFPSFQEKKI